MVWLKPSSFSFSNSHFLSSDNCDGNNCDGNNNVPVSLLSVKYYKKKCRCAKDGELKGQASTVLPSD